MWLLTNNAILTKDNLIKRKWKGEPECYFCRNPENIPHLFFQCSVARTVWAIIAKCFGANTIPKNLNQCWSWCEKWLPFGEKFHMCGVAAICWAIWKARNKACFEKVIIKSPIEIIYYVCALIRYWAGLYSEPDRKQLEDGLNTMLQIANKLLKRQKRSDGNSGQIQDGDSDGQDNAPA